MQRKAYCLTINNPTDDDEGKFSDPKFEYTIFGRERGESGTPHLQCYIHYKKKTDFNAVKKSFPTAHIEAARGTPQENKTYCSKDMDFVEYGDLPLTGGDRTKQNWDEAKELAKAGKLEEIPGNIYVPHYRSLKAIVGDHRPLLPPLDSLTNEWHYGPTGTGKSRSVREKHPNAYIKDVTEWWNGYDNQEVVIIEDIDKYHVKLGYYLKIWSDHYPFPGNMKGSGSQMIRPKKIIITSNYQPAEIWDDEQTIDPITRRFKLIPYKRKELVQTIFNFPLDPTVAKVSRANSPFSCSKCLKLHCDCNCMFTQ